MFRRHPDLELVRVQDVGLVQTLRQVTRTASNGRAQALDVPRAQFVDNGLTRIAEDAFIAPFVSLMPRPVADMFGQLQQKFHGLVVVAGFRFAVDFALVLSVRRVGSSRFSGFSVLPFFRGRRSFLLDVVVGLQ